MLSHDDGVCDPVKTCDAACDLNYVDSISSHSQVFVASTDT